MQTFWWHVIMEQKRGRVKTDSTYAILLSIYSGIILTVLGCFGAKQILIWMQTPKEVLHLAALYLRIYFLGMTATMVYNFWQCDPACSGRH